MEKPDEFADLRDQLVEKLGREGYCAVACPMLFRAFGKGEPWGFRSVEEGQIAHFFLKIHRQAVDLAGCIAARVIS
jgi:hypothetical protein